MQDLDIEVFRPVFGHFQYYYYKQGYAKFSSDFLETLHCYRRIH